MTEATKVYSRPLRMEDLIGVCNDRPKNHESIKNDQRKYSHTAKEKP